MSSSSSVTLRIVRSKFSTRQGSLLHSSWHHGGKHSLAPAAFCPLTTLSSNTLFNQHQFQASRHFASRRNDGNVKADGLPFSIAPEEALDKFNQWATDDQGLTWLLKPKDVRIGAAYVPVWSFDVNVRFVTKDPDGRRHFDWKPDIFSVYGSQSVIHIPGLSAYSGYSFRRSLVNPIVNTTLVFMGNETVPFDKWMMRDMVLSNGARLQVNPDPWNATRGRAFAVVEEELEGIAAAGKSDVKVQVELVSSRRVYLPIYAIDYKILGVEYRAFVSGCDEGAGVSGFSHKVIDVSDEDLRAGSHTAYSFLSRAAQAVGRVTFSGRGGFTFIMLLLQMFGGLAMRILARIPLLSAVGGVVVGFRKVVQPWLASRSASADWERQREHESLMDERFDHIDEFADSGAARKYFHSNRGRILRHLSGEQEHASGDFNWYAEWEEWARQQYQKQQQQASQYGGEWQRQQQRQQQQQQARARPQPKKPEYQWDFNPNDPYSVLGIKRGATKAEVSAAFRREMMKYHPDQQHGVSDAEMARATERSKLISEAYRKIRSGWKK